jgi:hypothetical protein
MLGKYPEGISAGMHTPVDAADVEQWSVSKLIKRMQYTSSHALDLVAISY